MINYQLAKIYKIVSNSHPEDVYYGSTCMPLSKRMTAHNYPPSKHACTSTKVIYHGDAEIVLVEDYPCDTKDELAQRERYYIENNNCVNKATPGLTAKETWTKYENAHRDERNAAKRVLYKCECGEMVTIHSKARHETRRLHLDNLAGVPKEGRQAIVVTCECGEKVASTSLGRHRKRSSHTYKMYMLDC